MAREITLPTGVYNSVALRLWNKNEATIHVSDIIANNPENIQAGDKLRLCEKDGPANLLVIVTATSEDASLDASFTVTYA